MRTFLRWTTIVLYLFCTPAVLFWPESGHPILAWGSLLVVLGALSSAPLVVIALRSFFARRVGLALLFAGVLGIWGYGQWWGDWLERQIAPHLFARLDLFMVLLGLQALLVVPTLFIVLLLRRDISLWLLGTAWFLEPALIALFASRFTRVAQLFDLTSLGTPRADLAWMLPNCLAGAACVLGGMGFVVYFLRLLIAEAEGRPVKTA